MLTAHFAQNISFGQLKWLNIVFFTLLRNYLLRHSEEYSHKQTYTDHTAQLIAKKEVHELKVTSYDVIKPGKIAPVIDSKLTWIPHIDSRE